MSATQAITYVDDSRLVELINAAARRVVYVAPGVSEPVADALSKAWDRLGRDAVCVILDVDPEVCRLGFGDLEGLKKATDAADRVGASLRRQDGVRIGLVISDDTTVIYSPTPLLLEEPPGHAQRPNAIQLQSPPPGVVDELGVGGRPDKQTVGVESVRKSDLAVIEADLATAPPMKFDLARRVRVFSTRFQFAELTLTGCYISRRKVRIPSHLVGLARNRDVESQFHAHFNLVSRGGLRVEAPEGRVLSEGWLQQRRSDIARDFLIPLKGYGSVVLRANKPALENAVEKLRADVALFQQGVVKALQDSMDANRKALVDALLPAVVASPPPAYTKFRGSSVPEEQVRLLLEKDIQRAFGQAEDLVTEMKVSLVFKDIAFESLTDEDFLKVAREAMPGVRFLHEEYEAAPATEDAQGRLDS